MLTGSCYCGAVHITVDNVDESAGGVVCQCVTCQKLHSSNSYNIQSTVADVKVVKGTPKVYNDDKTDSKHGVARSFCGDCSSALFSIPAGMPGVCFVKVGCLDKADKIKLVAEIYCDTSLSHNLLDKKVHNHKKFDGMMAKEIEV